jgi:hypothetical protein
MARNDPSKEIYRPGNHSGGKLTGDRAFCLKRP